MLPFILFVLSFINLDCSHIVFQEIKSRRQAPIPKAVKLIKTYDNLPDDIRGISIQENQTSRAIQQTREYDSNYYLKKKLGARFRVPDFLTNDIKSRRRKRYVAVRGWKKRHITYYISNWSEKLSEEIVATNIQKALDIWGRHGSLTFTRLTTPDADIKVSFESGEHGDGTPFPDCGVLAHAFHPDPSDSSGLPGDVHFNNNEDWADFANSNLTNLDPSRWASKGAVDFFTVALHELGHSLGLSHSEFQDAIMYDKYKEWKGEDETDLNYDDIMAIRELYNERTLKEDMPPMQAPTTEVAHRKRQRSSTTKIPRYTKKPNPRGDQTQPDICNGNFDAATIFRGDLLIFKKDYIWRLNSEGQMYPGYPAKIQENFQGFSKEILKIDAAYERSNEDLILFSGKNLWIFDGDKFVDNSPRPLTYYYKGLDLDGIDALYHWKRNGKTYIFKDSHYWRYDEDRTKLPTLDLGYPKPIKDIGALPANLDAVFTWTDGITYFLKGDYFWMLDKNRTTEMTPIYMPPIWFGCKERPRHYPSTDKPFKDPVENSGNVNICLQKNVIFMFLFILLAF